MDWKTIIKFWFEENGPDQWFFKKHKSFDRKIRTKFLKTYWQVVKGETEQWRKYPKGRLAEIIVLDQFARNMFRGSAQAFANDPLALALAQEAIRRGVDKKFTKDERMFLYLPFMHCESKKMQRESVRLFKSLGEKKNIWYAKDHKKIIDCFGRYPHRNAALGRTSTAAEKKFMAKHKGY